MELIKNKKWWHIAIVMVIVVGILTCGLCYSKSLQNQLEKVTTEKEYIETQMNQTLRDLESIQNELNTLNEELHQAHEKIEVQSKEIEQYKKEVEDEEAKWQRRYEEYPIATEAWIAMKAQGWSDVVCAGIMGNLMAETGGSGTLHLDWDSNGDNGYGLVQWTSGRRNDIKNKYGKYPSVKEQIQFIHDELYGTNGVRRQVTNSQFKSIMNADTPEECAYAFACYYERCATFSRSMRKGFARKAYDYFVDSEATDNV